MAEYLKLLSLSQKHFNNSDYVPKGLQWQQHMRLMKTRGEYKTIHSQLFNLS